MQIPCVYLPGPAPAVTVANTTDWILASGHFVDIWSIRVYTMYEIISHSSDFILLREHYGVISYCVGHIACSNGK